MKIAFVTLTGADDETNISEMVSISEMYPFVEWGILFSQNKSAVPRYPSCGWVDDLLSSSIPNLAAHLCGKWVDDILKGKFTFLDGFNGSRFSRFQLNLSKGRLASLTDKETFHRAVGDRTVMVGGNYATALLTGDFFGLNMHPLFDASGGKGILADWNSPFFRDGEQMVCGYAGGLGPDNVVEELDKIAALVGDGTVWIDMESKIRTKDRFDLDKCRKVLAAVQAWMS